MRVTWKGVLGGCGITILLVTAACVGGGAAKGRPPRGMIEMTAARYAEAKLAVARVSILRMWHPTDPHVGDGSCAIVEIRTPGGGTQRVVVAREGDPAAWEGLAVSERFGWDDFRPDSDVNCGLHNAGIRPSLL